MSSINLKSTSLDFHLLAQQMPNEHGRSEQEGMPRQHNQKELPNQKFKVTKCLEISPQSFTYCGFIF